MPLSAVLRSLAPSYLSTICILRRCRGAAPRYLALLRGCLLAGAWQLPGCSWPRCGCGRTVWMRGSVAALRQAVLHRTNRVSALSTLRRPTTTSKPPWWSFAGPALFSRARPVPPSPPFPSSASTLTHSGLAAVRPVRQVTFRGGANRCVYRV